MQSVIEIPKALRARPRDRRGYPIPFTVAIMRDGTPDFRIVDQHHRDLAISKRLCSLSGKPIRRSEGAFLVGGPKSAFTPAGAYLDGPMLPECALYALRVCPFLAATRFSTREFTEKGGGYEGVIVEHVDAEAGRPSVFVAVHCHGWHVNDRGSVLFIPALPYRAVSFWRHGAKLSLAAARALSSDIPPADVIGILSRSIDETEVSE